MERVACDVEGFHLGVGDLDAFFIGARIERAFDPEARLCRCRRDSSTTAILSVSGRPRHFCVIWQNSRCSILFHFDVPGG